MFSVRDDREGLPTLDVSSSPSCSAARSQQQLGDEQGEARSRLLQGCSLPWHRALCKSRGAAERVGCWFFFFFLEEEASEKEVASGTEGTGFGPRRNELKRERRGAEESQHTGLPRHSGSGAAVPLGPRLPRRAGAILPGEGGAETRGRGRAGSPRHVLPAPRQPQGEGAGPAPGRRGNPTEHVGLLPKLRRVLQEEPRTSPPSPGLTQPRRASC